MGEQFSLFDDDALPPAPKSPPPPRRGRTTGLFFAILPPLDVIAEIVECRASLFDKLDVHDRPFAAERFHVTLCPLGSSSEIPEGFVEAARKAADAVSAPPFEVTFDHVFTFGSGSKSSPTVLVSSDEMQPLAELHQKLRAALLKAGIKPISSSLTPHLTLSYGNGVEGKHAVDPIKWHVADFRLIKSYHGQGRYEELSRWSL